MISKENAGQTVTPDKSCSALAALAAVGGSKELLGALAEVFKIGDLTLDDRRYLTGPIITHKSSWADTTPKWMFDAVPKDRAAILFDGAPGIVGASEIAIAIYPASLDAPLQHDYADLYLWACTVTLAAHKGKDTAELWQMLNQRPIEDSEVLDRAGRLWHVYSRLAHDIRGKVVSAQAARDRETAREAKASAPPVARPPRRPAPVGGLVQASLF